MKNRFIYVTKPDIQLTIRSVETEKEANEILKNQVINPKEWKLKK